MHSLAKLSLNMTSACYGDDEPDKWDIQVIVDILYSQPALEELGLEFSEGSTFDNIVGHKLELPSIRSLSLHWHASTNFGISMRNYPVTDVPKLFGLLVVRNVKTFRFKISRETEEDFSGDEDLEYEKPLLLGEHLKFFLGDGGHFPLLESFHLELYSTVLDHVCLPSSFIQNIKHLSLHINTGFSLAEINDGPDCIPGPLPNLQRLTLQNCDTFEPETVEVIVNAVKAGGNWANFQQLLVDECRFLSWSSLQDILGPGKLEVFPNTRRFVEYRDDYYM